MSGDDDKHDGPVSGGIVDELRLENARLRQRISDETAQVHKYIAIAGRFKNVLDRISQVNAMNYEYRQWARNVLDEHAAACNATEKQQ